MIAIAADFIQSEFLSGTVFIFCGETPNEFLLHFDDIQVVDMHAYQVAYGLDLTEEERSLVDKVSYDFNYLRPIEKEDLKRFLEIGDPILHVLDYLDEDGALEKLRAKYPKAIYRPLIPNPDRLPQQCPEL